MKLNQKVKIFLIFMLAWPIFHCPAANLLTFSEQAESIVEKGRNLFYASVEDESNLDSAFTVFEYLKNEFPAYEGRAITYIGALTALKGRHTFWVYTKYKLVKNGLQIMDQGIEKSPDDIEALFVYGSTCHFMPFLFGRNEEAQTAFKRIMQLLPKAMYDYDQELVGNVIDFLLEHTRLTVEERTQLTILKTKLDQK